MTIALRVLAVDEEALRHDQMKVVLCARHGDVEEPPFLLDLGRRADAEIRLKPASDGQEPRAARSTLGRSGTTAF
jgi:hypothetical protein